MRITGCQYPQSGYTYFQNNKQNRQNVYFTGINKTITSSYGAFSKATQDSLKNLHDNMNFIHEFFLRLARNPHKSIIIKNGFTELEQKNRNSGISFDLPDNQGILTVRRLLKNSNLLRFVVEKDGNRTYYLTDGYTKSVSNVNQNNPHLLPRTLKYMMPNEIKESNIEKYITYADEKIQKYKTYLEQYNDTNSALTDSLEISIKERNAEKMRRYRASKKQQAAPNTPLWEVKKSQISNIMALFQKSPEEFPAHLRLLQSPSGSVLGFSLQTEDGATLKVSKKLNAKYGGSMAYLSFEKFFPNGEKSYMSIDLQTHKFLKMKDAGKPIIRGHAVFEYSPDEVKKRNMVEKFESYFDEIFKTGKQPELKSEVELVKPVSEPASVPVEKIKQFSEPQAADKMGNIEELKENTFKRAKEDANILSDLYFKIFVEEFNKNITQKLNDFRADLDKFLQSFWQK